jgi:hypothetical protein
LLFTKKVFNDLEPLDKQYYEDKGYTPKWIRGGEEKERIMVRQRLEGSNLEL